MACKTDNITQEYLKSVLDYDPDTGVFKWNVNKGKGVKIGFVAGTIRKDGYIEIQIDGIKYLAHRLAFLYINGWLPSEVDHINNNGPKTDNRICNLRDATHSQNQQNKGHQKNNKSGYKGVRWHNRHKKWYAQIKIDRKQIHLGSFDTPEKAHEAYKEAALRLHGEYARF